MFCCRLLTADAQKSYLYYRLPGPLPASIGYRYRYRLVTSSYRSYYLRWFRVSLVAYSRSERRCLPICCLFGAGNWLHGQALRSQAQTSRPPRTITL